MKFYVPIKTSILSLIMCMAFVNTYAQTVNLTSTNLPIFIVDTESEAINQTYKVDASMKIVYRGDGETTFLTDQNNANYVEYDGRVGINIRGSSSSDFPKLQYSIEMWDDFGNNNPQKVLDFPEEHDFILQAPYIDKSLMRNVLTYQLSNMMGRYATRTKFCELILDGEYVGVYVFMERIKQDDNRVDVESLDITDTAYPEVTGGYIWKVDKGEDGFATTETNRYRFHDPKEEDLNNEQKAYLQQEVEAFEAIMNSNNYDDPLTGYASAIDVASWIDQFLLQEWTKNPDAYGSSMYYYKHRYGKLRMGPVWDMNLALGASYHGLAHFTSSWTTTFGHALIGPGYNQDLFNDETFQCLMNNRWTELRQVGNEMHEDVIFGVIDSIYNLLNQGAQQRNFTKWNNLGQQSWLEAPGYADRDTYEAELDYLKEWISERLLWIDSNMETGTCPTATPDGLVIDEIMYNPAVTGTADEADYEYIEIYNNGSSIINLAGIQFTEGVIYTFSAESIYPGDFIVLASNATAFQQEYGFTPNGEYSGNLSNSGEKIVLADIYGYTLDEVEYNDAAPWPVTPDGAGASLELRAPNLDNTEASNWFANLNDTGSVGETNVEDVVDCSGSFPDIVINEIMYNASNTSDSGDWIELYNNTSSSVNLSNWIFQDEGHAYTIDNGTIIGAGQYTVLVQSEIDFSSIYTNVNVDVELGFGFSNGGETVTLLNADGCTIDEVTYDDIGPWWPTTPDGTGPSLQLDDVNADNNIGSHWSASSSTNGTPGASNNGNTGGSPTNGLTITAFLEGFMNGTSMRTSLADISLLPNSQPYNIDPFYNNESKSTSNFPNNTVDWILVEIRSSNNPATVLEQQSLLLRSDGVVMDTDGTTSLSFNTSGSHYIAIYHKSHLGVLSANTVNLSGGSIDFSSSINSASGNEQQIIVAGKACLFSGDFDNNGLINNLDYNRWSGLSAALNQYLDWDADGNGIVNNLDYNIWDTNKSKVGISEIQK